MDKVKYLGKWWSDSSIDIVEIEGKAIALYGWNGEEYIDCWEVTEISSNTGWAAGEETYIVRPVYDKDLNTIEYRFS